MKIYKIKVNGKSYKVELEAIEEVASETIKEVKKEEVKKGQVLLLIEAMKLENEVLSPVDGEVSEILVSKGKTVANKELLIKIK